MFVGFKVICFVQLGDGSVITRYTPVSVYGLDSGVEMIALGSVRFVATGWGLCIE